MPLLSTAPEIIALPIHRPMTPTIVPLRKRSIGQCVSQREDLSDFMVEVHRTRPMVAICGVRPHPFTLLRPV